VDSNQEMVDMLRTEHVDVVVACDLPMALNITIDAAAREAGVMVYAAGTYGFYGYVLADLGVQYEYVATPPSTPSNPTPALVKKALSYPPLAAIFDRSNWHLTHRSVEKGGSPFRDLTRNQTKERVPAPTICLMGLWEWENAEGELPPGKRKETSTSDSSLPRADTTTRWKAQDLVVALGVNQKAGLFSLGQVESHLTYHATHMFPPTMAILGGLLAQDVLRALSKKDKPIVNFLALDSQGGTGIVSRWAMADAVDA